jgi:hypothetical protein
MARPIPEKNKTVKVRSTVTVLGLNPGQIAEIDDTKQVRDLIAGGLLVLIVSKSDLAPKALAPAPAPTPETVLVEDDPIED